MLPPAWADCELSDSPNSLRACVLNVSIKAFLSFSEVSLQNDTSYSRSTSCVPQSVFSLKSPTRSLSLVPEPRFRLLSKL